MPTLARQALHVALAALGVASCAGDAPDPDTAATGASSLGSAGPSSSGGSAPTTSSGGTGATDPTTPDTAGTTGDPQTTGDASSTSSGPDDTTGSTSSSAGTGATTDSSGTTGGGGLVWSPPPGTSWQWQLSGALDTSLDVQMYDIDLFDTDAGTIADLRADGRVVICYFSAGSHEDWRPDAGDFPPASIGEPLDGWPGERWLDVRDPEVRAVQAARLDLAATKGCDGVEPDNVDGYTNGSGFPLTYDDQLDYNLWLASEAHARDLSIGLKNDLDQVGDLEPAFDWALNEECVDYDECDVLTPFIDADKAVFHVEYVDDPGQGPGKAASVCPQTMPLGFSTLIKEWDLTAWRIPC